ncbi:MAG TPA: alpha/beta fold hydrolase [Candidatus Acidoferrales bacterium]|nr:alpha/beta fold hydrolase [Candidatus Acidoferrales bacterium]
MKRWEIVCASVGALLLLASAWAIHRVELPRETFTLSAAGCSMPITVIDPPHPGRASAILFHGIAVNRRVMQLLGENLARENGLRAYLVDLPGHGDNTDSFSFARAEKCAAATVETLIRDGRVNPTQTVLVGHSMGAAIAIRLADSEPTATTIAISPAPLVLPRRMPANLLVFSAQFDLSALRQQAQSLAGAAGSDRSTPEDFLQLRAFHLQRVSPADHTSILVDPRVTRQAANWIRNSLAGAGGLPQAAANPSSFALLRPTLASLVGLAAMLMMFPAALALATRAPQAPQREIVATQPTRALALAEGAAFALASVFVLGLGVPLKFLHMYSGDYLVSLLALFAVFMLAMNRKAAKESWSCNARQWLVAAILGFAMLLAIGAWLNWRVSDLWLNEARWLRFAAVLPFAFLFAFAEETVLGPVDQGQQRALRYAVCLLVRLELWLACILAFYTLSSGQFLIALLIGALAVFSIFERLGTDALRRRTGSPTAAALFNAILVAWFIAAVFPLT